MVITFLNLLSKRGFATLHAAHVREHEPLEVHGFLVALLEKYFVLEHEPKGRNSLLAISN